MRHACDLGVTQVAMGNLFFELLLELGPNKKAQVGAMWEKLKSYYSHAQPTSQLQSLTYEMIRQPKKKTKTPNERR